jgi:pyruvate-formate lyase-activating enzyme
MRSFLGMPPRHEVDWDPDAPPFWFPTEDQVTTRLDEILSRGSVNLGASANTERLMLMVTRSCELRCGYCFVQKTETGLEMSLETALRGVDLIMSSERERLEVQFFGGEPSRRWDIVSETMTYANDHPGRNGRRLQFVLTTNGTGLDEQRVRFLERYPVMVLFSLDGDARAHKRFRQSHLLSDADAYAAIDRTVELLSNSTVGWFMNATMAPNGADEVYDRYVWARERGIKRLQLNYSVGHYWRPEQERRYLEHIQRALFHHAAWPEGLQLFNWRSDCEPVMLSDDLIVDTDGSVMHDGAIFLERSLPKLKDTYDRGHIQELTEFDPLRWSLARLNDVMTATYPEGSREHRAIVQNIRMGAAVDLVIQNVQARLGKLCPMLG